jgi:two-component system, chemotaxis family, CheB/CheR fusion protein
MIANLMAKRPGKPSRKRTSSASAKPGGEVRAKRPRMQPARLSVVPRADEPDSEPEARQRPFPVVGIGASAGGLEAFTSMLQALPADTHMAFVLVQHMSPTHESLLSGLLAPHTRMPVEQAKDGMSIAADHVYVIPPDCNMGIMNGTLHLLPRRKGAAQHMPIDFFLRSLAEDQKNNAIGVILSGTASDGALGMRAIKGEGGITMAQDPATARYDGMPRAAIGAGAIDVVLPIEQLAAEITKIGRHPYVRLPSVDLAEDGDQLKRIFFLLRQASGVDFTYYKHATIKRRLKRRMVLHKLERLQDYVRLLQHTAGEIDALYQDMLIHVTGFFREPEAFVALREVVFPAMLAGRPHDLPIRIWIPGCSTGEETYSIAIALCEYLDGKPQQGIQTQIFATDVSEAAIDKARNGFYPENIKADVGAERLRRFFAPADGGYRVAKSVRDMCIFARQDLTRDPPFSQLDLVSCRNVLIYLGAILQQRAMSIFHYALKPNGFLLLGASESIGSQADLFAIADKAHKVYAKKPSGARPFVEFSSHLPERVELPKPVAGGKVRADLHAEIDRLLLARFAPSGVVVDDSLYIVQVRGQTGRYLEPAAGEATLNVLKMARPGLMIELRAAVAKARKTNAPVRKQGVRVQQNGHTALVDLEVVPLPGVFAEKLWLILFSDSVPSTAGPAAIRAPDEARELAPAERKQSRGRVRELEHELAATREYLHSIIQDQEASNEELQSANEEILSSNEELQSTNEELETAKEELQSTNEELNTVNDELHTRNRELSQLNNDLTNVLASVHIPIVMIGNDLRIRRYTPMAGTLFNLIPTDVGRPITDIRPKVDIPQFEQLIARAIDTVQNRELEVKGPHGRCYSMRLRPYKTADNRIEGCVVALVDLPQGRTERDGIASRDLPLLVLDANRRVIAASSRFCKEQGVAADELRGAGFHTVLAGRFEVPPFAGVIERLLRSDAALDDLQHGHSLRDRDGAAWRVAGCRIPGPDVALLLVIERDEPAAAAATAQPSEP